MAAVHNRQPAILKTSIIKVNAQSNQLLQNVVRGFAVCETMSMSDVPYTREIRRGWDWNDNVLMSRNCPVCIRMLVEEYRVDRERRFSQGILRHTVQHELGEEQPQMRARHEKSPGAIRGLRPTTNSAGSCLRMNARQERAQLPTVQSRLNVAGANALQLFREIRERHG